MSHSLLQAWERTLRNHGGERAVAQARDSRVATFSEIDALADSWLRQHVPDPESLHGRAVLFCLENGIEWLATFLGLQKAGAVAVPLDPGEPSEAQLRIGRALRAAGVWTGSTIEGIGDSRRYREPEACLIKLTSGSTGVPRPLLFTAGQMLADGRQVTKSMGITRRDLNYALIPFGHSYGLGNLTIPLIAHAVPLVCGTVPLPHAVEADFSRWQPTVFPSVPAIWRALATSDISLASLRLAISAGAPLPPEVAREFETRFGRRLHSFYGSSETGGITFDRTGTAALAGGVGHALHGVQLELLRGGRLRVASPAVHTVANRARAGSTGAWVMPDRVGIDARGSVTLLGRRGSTAKIGGRRVNLAEVSSRLRQLSDVSDVWVGTSGGNDPVLGAVVATKRSPAEVRAQLAIDTAPWKIPKKLATVAALPLTSRGKNDTRAMRAMVFPSANA